MVVDRMRPEQQKLMKKGQGQIIHISDFIEEKNGCLIVHNQDGIMIRDAQHIIYPGASSNAWWDHTQLLAQVNDAISIFKEAYPDCTALFVFDQSSAHGSLRPNVLHTFEMNKGNGGKQRKQKNTVILINNLHAEFSGKPQKMTMEADEVKGIQQTLKEHGFSICGMCVKCSPVCPFENNNCCMACLLSKQDDFHLQISLLEQKITLKGHLCIFLPKFHCELNPIEMAHILSSF
jgi:hypothetical protein